jgi:nitrogen fixation/metabolism regulation signal transduction histidine kinase
MKDAKRTRLFIDPQVQGRLLCRVVLYWCMAVAIMGTLAAVQVAIESRHAPSSVVINRTLLAFGPSLIAAVLLLPVVLFDALRFSNKFAGPMHRLRREVKRLADGDSYTPIDFRKGDFWYDLAQEFNRLADKLERLDGPVGETSHKSNDRDQVLAAAK